VSNPAYHPIATGTDLTEALENIERILDYAGDRPRTRVELAVRGRSWTHCRRTSPTTTIYSLYVVTRSSAELGRHATLAAAAIGRTVVGSAEGY
jgi:hypothetical protein